MLLLPCEHPQHSVDARPQTHCYHSASRCLCHVNTPFFWDGRRSNIRRRVQAGTLAWKQSTFVQKTCGALLLYEKKKKEKRIQCVLALGSRRCTAVSCAAAETKQFCPQGSIKWIWSDTILLSPLVLSRQVTLTPGKESRASDALEKQKQSCFFCLATMQIDFLFFFFF